MRIAIDTGGTFTDVVLEDHEGRVHLYKSPTTPADPVEGVLAAIDLAAQDQGVGLGELLAQTDHLIYGTTLATNVVLTGRAARTAFLTTAGHPDVLVLREGGRIGLPTFDFSIANPRPYVPRALTFEIPERIGSTGEVVTPLDEPAVRAVIERLRALEVEAIGVSLLWSIANPVHEQRIGELLAAELPGVPYSLSHVINPSLREYRRASATCIDASLKPLMSAYLEDLEQRLIAQGFGGRLLVVTSQGGMMEAAALARAPVHSIKSGPAMAPVAGHHYAAREVQADTAIVADTGGTSYDVGLVRRGRIPWSRETWIGKPYLGHMTGFPSVDVRSVGAGGGSIAWIDDGGLLHVGPQSAGSNPGPACYAAGGEHATVTDAAVILGYIDPGYFLGGRMALDAQAARCALEQDVGGPLGLDVPNAALSVLQVATENMVGAIEDITVNQGIDPRTAVLIGGGGAAGLNSVAIARRLACPKIIIPDVGAALSAAGAHLSALTAEFSALLVTNTAHFDHDGVNAVLAELTGRCETFIKGPGAQSVSHRIDLFVEARYAEQIWEVEVPLRERHFTSQSPGISALETDFHATHRELFAFDDPESEIEFITWRARVSCTVSDGSLGAVCNAAAHSGGSDSRPAYFAGVGLVDVKVRHVEDLAVDQGLEGPAIVESPFTTVVIDPGASVYRSAAGSLVIDP